MDVKTWSVYGTKTKRVTSTEGDIRSHRSQAVMSIRTLRVTQFGQLHLIPVQTDYGSNLAGAYTTVVSDTFGPTNAPLPTISSTPQTGSSTPVVTSRGNRSATSSVNSAFPTDTCPPTPSHAIGAGLPAGLDVPLFRVLAVLLWLLVYTSQFVLTRIVPPCHDVDNPISNSSGFALINAIVAGLNPNVVVHVPA